MSESANEAPAGPVLRSLMETYRWVNRREAQRLARVRADSDGARVEQLEEELRTLKAEHEAAAGHVSVTQRLAARVRELEERGPPAQNTISFQLGYSLIQATKSPRDLVRLPMRLHRLRLEAKRRRERPKAAGHR